MLAARKALRIAQVAPLYLPVPPQLYGGTERVVHGMTEALVARGHDVTLFASGDSRTSARLVPVVPRALWAAGALNSDAAATHFRMLAEVFRHAADFDVIHTHTDFLAFPYISRSAAAVVTTWHGRTDRSDLHAIFRLFPEARLVSISRAQGALAPGANWIATVPHGLNLEDYPFDATGGEGLLFLGRLSPEKAPHVAIDVAVAAGVPLTLAGRIDPEDRAYFEREVEPRLGHALVRYVGEVGGEKRERLLGAARALLLPIDWPEPFGLVMAEAMACGTPVIAKPRGSVPEVVVDGVTGFLAEDQDALVEAVLRVRQLDRAACRRHVENHFSAEVMITRYEQLYWRMAAEREAAIPRSGFSAQVISGLPSTIRARGG